MKENTRSQKLITFLISTLLLGIGAWSLFYMFKTKPQPKRKIKKNLGRLVRFFEVKKTSHQISIKGYGTTKAGEEWTAIAEVRGRVTKLSNQFEPGEFLPANTELVTIDPTDYQLTSKQHQAEVKDKNARIKELKQRQENYSKLRILREEQVELAKQEVQRTKKLLGGSVATQREFENASNNFIAQKTALQEIDNQIKLIHFQNNTLNASLELAQIRLKQANRNLERTVIKMPFAARCISRYIKPNQYALAGEKLGKFYSLDTIQVLVFFEVRKIFWLFPKGIGIGPMDFSQGKVSKEIWDKINVQAQVSWSFARQQFFWKGKVARFHSSLDPKTRTMGVLIEVKNPYKNVMPTRPLLVPDMFCEVKLFGVTIPEAIVIPRNVLHNEQVYLLQNNKLKIVSVKILAYQQDQAVIESGLKEGDKIILSGLFPIMEGMPLRGHKVPHPLLKTNQQKAGK